MNSMAQRIALVTLSQDVLQISNRYRLKTPGLHEVIIAASKGTTFKVDFFQCNTFLNGTFTVL